VWRASNRNIVINNWKSNTIHISDDNRRLWRSIDSKVDL
jgi:hypothetical protein